MAIITPALVSALFTGFRAEFQRVYGETPSHWDKVATLMPSTSKSNTYGWLGQFPQLVEWVGPRVLKDMAAHGYSITNKLFESTVGVKRTDIEDDEVGIYKPLFGEMGRAAKSFPDELVYGLLRLGLSTLCFDGQYFFDTDHPVYPNVDGTGAAATIANIADGTDIPWFLLDTSRVLKPVLFQERTKPELTSMTRADDEAVFMTDEYRFGIRYRCNSGFGFWQTAYCSKKPLTDDNFNAAYDAMTAFKADGGRPLGIKPTLLVVPTNLRTAAAEVVQVARRTDGSDNPNAGIVDVLVTPWLN
ncbi:Mu-like prophage major head subunit gpT family protein [Solidesulfovibrio carbinolicus]|uniref:Head protein n=1 Tax=Solidesulfovibrio carbinolicus TaxID=296842 RepID=A0A4P6HIY1_9BACT|nr:Mu-like prophage major head subunit gpT family protein [Solidesulfovibrio carbinolicus]QAZ67037.1 head protein [Solidesulfovibrio carbinolicus]